MQFFELQEGELEWIAQGKWKFRLQIQESGEISKIKDQSPSAPLWGSDRGSSLELESLWQWCVAQDSRASLDINIADDRILLNKRGQVLQQGFASLPD
jgi:hypothetical protein